MKLGEGFVIADGTPLDGSRSYYFNALRFDVDLRPDQKLTFFLHAGKDDGSIISPRSTIRTKPWSNSRKKRWPPITPGRSGRRRSTPTPSAKRPTGTGSGPWRARSTRSGPGSRRRSPGRCRSPAEAALQTGSYGPAGRVGLRGDRPLSMATTSNGAFPCSKRLTLGAILLSGDDPATGRMEGWDPVFSRWPKWERRLDTWTGLEPARAGSPTGATLQFHLRLRSVLGFGRAGRTPTVGGPHRLGAALPPGPASSPAGRGFTGESARRRPAELRRQQGPSRDTCIGTISGPEISTRRGADGFNWLRFRA